MMKTKEHKVQKREQKSIEENEPNHPHNPKKKKLLQMIQGLWISDPPKGTNWDRTAPWHGQIKGMKRMYMRDGCPYTKE